MVLSGGSVGTVDAVFFLFLEGVGSCTFFLLYIGSVGSCCSFFYCTLGVLIVVVLFQRHPK